MDSNEIGCSPCSYSIEGPDKKRPQKDTGSRQQGGKKKPQKYRFGDVGTLELSTVVRKQVKYNYRHTIMYKFLSPYKANLSNFKIIKR